MRKRDDLKKKCNLSKDKSLLNSYKKCRNDCNKQIRKNKVEYIRNGINENKHDVKKTWRNIRHVIPSKKKSLTYIQRIEIDDKVFTCNKDILNSLNNFFAEIGPNLARKLICPLVTNSNMKKRKFY